MQPDSIWAISIAVFILIQFIILPRMRRAASVVLPSTALARSVRIAVLQGTSTIALLAALALTGFLGWLWWTSGVSGNDFAAVSRAMQGLTRMKTVLSDVYSKWSIGAALLLSTIWLVLLRRAARTRVSAVVEQLRQREWERLNALAERCELPPLRDTEPMTQLRTQLQELAMVRDAVAKDLESGEITAEKAAEVIREVDQRMQQLAAILHMVDLYRRIDVKVDEATVADAPSRGWAAKLRQAFISEGAVRGLSGGARVLLIATLVLLSLSLLGVTGMAMGAPLQRQFVRLDELRIRFSQEAAAREWADAVNRVEPAQTIATPEPWTEEDEAALDTLADLFEQRSAFAMTPPTYAAVMNATRRPSDALRGVLARQAILESYADGDRAVRRASTSERSLDQAIYSDAEASGRNELRERFKRDLRASARERPGLWVRLRTVADEVPASFRRTAQTRDVARHVLSQVFGAALGGTPTGDGIVEGAARAVAAELTPDRLAQVYQQQFHEFTTAALDPNDAVGRNIDEFLSGGPRRAVWTEAELGHLQGALEHLPTSAQIEAALADRPPVLSNSASLDGNRGAARRTLDSLMAGADLRERVRAADALATYEDYFPGQVGDDSRSERGKWLAAISDDVGPETPPPPSFTLKSDPPGPGGGFGSGGLGSGGEGPSGRPRPSPGAPSVSYRPSRVGGAAPAASVASSFRRARSFTSLRGFARVGGVLIGQEPKARESVDYQDLAWSFQTGNVPSVVFTLRDGAGRKVSLPPYRASLVAPALAYAADGRPTTVTMVTAEPLTEMRILLHPALVNTPLGCRAIDLDRLVDKHARRDVAVHEAEQVVVSELALYELTVFSLLSRSTAESMGDLLHDLGADTSKEEASAQLRQIFKISASSILLREKAQGALKRDLGSAAKSVIVGKPDVFDQRVVSVLRKCMRSASLDAFDTCVSAAWDPSTKAPEHPPKYQVWSGVRERGYGVDRELSFAASSAQAGSPLRFMLQVAFTNVPKRLQANGDWIDPAPWEFPAVASKIEEDVRKGVAASKDGDGDTMSTMEEFTRLQRLFRAILEGRLGASFPLERLRVLAREAKPYRSASARTLSWNIRPAYTFVDAKLAQLGAKMVPDERTRLISCRTSMKAHPQKPELWQRCSLATAQSVAGRYVSMLLDDLILQRKKYATLRQQLGVDADELFVIKNGHACASL